ncbi:MAG: cache domain-containing protein [Syntrophobacteraceae bacterium]
MKKVLTACLTIVFVLTVALYAFAAEPNRDAIKKRVDEIVTGINSGKTAADFTSAAQENPYVFIMKRDGTMLVHPMMTGQNIKAGMEAIYNALSKADANGIWVTYEWQGKTKNTYVRETKDGLIVGSGY